MAYTIASARAQVLDHLDDESGQRFARAAGATSYVKVDRALRSSIDRCLDDYIEAGGDRFDEVIEVSTSATDGTVGLATYDVLKVKGVLFGPTAGVLVAIEAGDDIASQRADLNERDLKVRIVRQCKIVDPPNDTDLLMGTVAGVARSWDAFDEWVCCRAALQLGIKDDEMRKALVATMGDLEKSVLGGSRNPKSVPWGTERRHWTSRSASFQWLWTARTQTLQLVTRSF